MAIGQWPVAFGATNIYTTTAPEGPLGGPGGEAPSSRYVHFPAAEKLPEKRPPFVPKATHLEFDQALLIADPKLRATARTLAPSLDTQEMPVHPNLIGKKLWDNSTSNEHTRTALHSLNAIEELRALQLHDNFLADALLAHATV